MNESMSTELSPGVPSFDDDGEYWFFHCSPSKLVSSLESKFGCRQIGRRNCKSESLASPMTFRVVEYENCGWPAICPLDAGGWTLSGMMPDQRLEELSAELDCEYVFLGIHGTAGGVVYKQFRSGKLVEHVADASETGMTEFFAVESDDADASNDVYSFIDSSVARLGIIVPSCYCPFERTGKPIRDLNDIDAYSYAVSDAYILEGPSAD